MSHPCSETQIQNLIAEAEQQMNEPLRRFWDMVRITPVKWQQSPWGDRGEGFWVVALMGLVCLYYNDIEDGFNESEYDIATGHIREYFCNQSKLYYAIRSWHQTLLRDVIPTPEQIVAKERREAELAQIAQDESAKRWWAALGDEIGPETCKSDGCTKKRIAHSVLCRKHHSEQIQCHPYPFLDDA